MLPLARNRAAWRCILGTDFYPKNYGSAFFRVRFALGGLPSSISGRLFCPERKAWNQFRIPFWRFKSQFLPQLKRPGSFLPRRLASAWFRCLKTGHPLRFKPLYRPFTARHPSSRVASLKAKRTGLFYRNAFCGTYFTGKRWNGNISAINGWGRLL